MFHNEKLARFILFEMSIQRANRLRNRYVYNEEEGDITTIYQSTYEPSTNNQDMAKSITIAQNDLSYYDPFATVLIELSFMLKFKLLFKNTSDPVTNVFLGRTDAMLWPVAKGLHAESLLPIFTMYNSIWIPNLATKGSPTYFLDQFHIKLWIAFIISFTIICMLAHFIGYQLKKSYSQRPEILKLFSILVNQGGDEFIRFASPKILIISLSILAIVISSAFGAFLSSHLAIRFLDIPFTNLVELLNHDDYTICAFSDSVPLSELQIISNSDKQLKARLNTLKCDSMLNLFGAVVNKTCPHGKIAFVTDVVTNEAFKMCNLNPIPGKYFNHYFTMLVTPNYKYQEQLNVGIIRLATAGVANFLQNKFPTLDNKARYENMLMIPEGSPVTMHQIIYILIFVTMGGILSGFLVIIERVVAARV